MRSLLLATKTQIQTFLKLFGVAITGATNAAPIVITSAAHGRNTGEIITIAGVGGNTAANSLAVITNASNAAPIVITSAAHGRNTGEIITIAGVGGNTAANGNWTITRIDANSFSLNGSTGNGAYTSGGTWTTNSRWVITVVDADRFSLNGSTGNGAYTSGGTWNAGYKDSVADVTEEGKPKPNSGQAFYGIEGKSFSNSNGAGTCLDEEYSVDVTVTLRAGYEPADRIYDILTGTGTLWALVEALRANLHMNYKLMNDANANATYGCAIGGAANGFEQPLRFASATYLGAKGPDWFWSDGSESQHAITGVACKLHFDFARRVQTIESET